MKNLKKTKILLQAEEEITLESLVYKVHNMVDHDYAATFIALLEKQYESWDVTLDLCRHFKGLEKVYVDKVKEDEDEDLSPKNLIGKKF